VHGMGLMKHLTGKKHEAAYEYMKRYMSGWQGAFVSRYGYYIPVEAERGVRKHCDASPYSSESAEAVGARVCFAGTHRDERPTATIAAELCQRKRGNVDMPK
jgi:hypothetical protein